MGYPKPVSASGKTWDTLGKTEGIVNPWGDYDRSKFTVEDLAVGFIRFDNGAVVVLESSFMLNNDAERWQSSLYGTKAGADIKFWEKNPITIYREDNKQLFDMSPANIPEVKSAHTAEIQAFVDAIKNGKPSPVPGLNGLILNAIFDALYKSAETSMEVPIDVSF